MRGSAAYIRNSDHPVHLFEVITDVSVSDDRPSDPLSGKSGERRRAVPRYFSTVTSDRSSQILVGTIGSSW